MGKRANTEGSIYQRSSDGRWFGSVTVPGTGGAQRRTVSRSTRAAVVEAMTDLRRQVNAGATGRRDGTLGAFIETWIAHQEDRVREGSLKARSLESYAGLARTWIVPTIGSRRLSGLSPNDVRTVTRTVLDAGRSDSTAQRVYGVLRMILNEAVADGMLAANPCARVGAPRNGRGVQRKGQPLSTAALAALVDDLEGDPFRPVVFLAGHLGLRIGEVLGLTWSDVDLETGTLRVERQLSGRASSVGYDTPKSRNAIRALPVDDDTVSLLRSHRRAQQERRLAASEWFTPGPHGEPIVSLDGRPVAYHVVDKWWRRQRADGVVPPGLRIHDLRHTAATVLLEAGAPMAIVSRVLGHARIGLTVDTYGHVVAEAAREAMDVVAAARRNATA